MLIITILFSSSSMLLHREDASTVIAGYVHIEEGGGRCSCFVAFVEYHLSIELSDPVLLTLLSALVCKSFDHDIHCSRLF